MTREGFARLAFEAHHDAKMLAIALDALKAIEDEPHPGYAPGRATKALDDIRELDQ